MIPTVLARQRAKITCLYQMTFGYVSVPTPLYVVWFCCCLFCSSFIAACHNPFLFSFGGRKHDIEASHRCMHAQKAQLSAIPSASRLPSGLSEGWCPQGIAAPTRLQVEPHCETGGLLWISVVVSRVQRSRTQEAEWSTRSAGGRQSRSTVCPKSPIMPWRTWERWAMA